MNKINDLMGFGKPATIRRSDGSWENITYQGSLITGTIVTKTVSGWLDNPAPAAGEQPDEATNRVVTEIEAFNETGTFSREEKIQGVTVSNSWGERFKDKSGMVVEKSHVETGSARLTTLSHRFSNDVQFSAVERGKMKSVQFPDGTVETHSYTAQGDNTLTTTDRGVGNLSAVSDGTRTVSVQTKQKITIKETVSDISSGITLSTREAIAFDSNNQPTRWVHDNDIDDFSETINGCCGIDSTRSRDGITTSYTRDGLKRPKTEISRVTHRIIIV